MKKITTIAFVALIIIGLYLFYKLIFVEELSKIDNILFTIFLAGGIINSSIIISKRKKKQSEE